MCSTCFLEALVLKIKINRLASKGCLRSDVKGLGNTFVDWLKPNQIFEIGEIGRRWCKKIQLMLMKKSLSSVETELESSSVFPEVMCIIFLAREESPEVLLFRQDSVPASSMLFYLNSVDILTNSEASRSRVPQKFLVILLQCSICLNARHHVPARCI